MVAARRGRRPHQRPLPRVAVASAAEDGQDATLGERAQGAEHLDEGVRGVGIIDEDVQPVCLIGGA